MWLANLTLTQIYVPLTLTAGLTQMWSLSVEVTFYLVLPILALLARRLPVRRPGAGDRRRGGGQLWRGDWCPIHAPQGINSAELAAGVLFVVRRGHAAGGVDASARIGRPHRLARAAVG